MLVGTARGYRNLDPAHADGDDEGADLEEPEPDRATGALGELGMAETDTPQCGQKHVGHGGEPEPKLLARLVATSNSAPGIRGDRSPHRMKQPWRVLRRVQIQTDPGYTLSASGAFTRPSVHEKPADRSQRAKV